VAEFGIFPHRLVPNYPCSELSSENYLASIGNRKSIISHCIIMRMLL